MSCYISNSSTDPFYLSNFAGGINVLAQQQGGNLVTYVNGSNQICTDTPAGTACMTPGQWINAINMPVLFPNGMASVACNSATRICVLGQDDPTALSNCK